MLRRAAVERRADFESVAGLAALHAERGETAEAEPLFDESYLRYRGVSPFPLAQLEFQRGHMWREAGHPLRAHDWFDAAWRRVPAYAQAEGHLAEVEAELGEREDAIARLRRLRASPKTRITQPNWPAYWMRMATRPRQTGGVRERRSDTTNWFPAIPPLSLTMPPSSGARRVATHSGR